MLTADNGGQPFTLAKPTVKESGELQSVLSKYLGIVDYIAVVKCPRMFVCHVCVYRV